MLQKHFVRISTLFLFCFASISVAYAAGENSPQVNLSFEKSIYGFNEDVPVRVAISNTGKSEMKILRWLTPVDGVKGDLFSVTLDGSPVEYTGALFKRAVPTELDYLTLKPGKTIVYNVNLADYYDLSRNGYYQISYRTESYNLSAAQSVLQQKLERLESESVSIWIYGTAKKMPPGVSSPDFTNSGCSAAQTANLPPAVSGSNNYAANSYSYLNAGTIDSRYITWFGVYDSTRYSTVRTHFLNIKNLLVADSFSINCAGSQCTSNTYAYVFPTDTSTHTVYVCHQFDLAPTTGTDSKAGTLIHEMSHFNDIGLTKDYVYGQTAAMSLAVSNPGNAIMNADNHEYFAEASPPPPPTAAAVTISGRILSPNNRGLANVKIMLISSASGLTIATRTNSSGYYRFADIEVGQTYILSANAKQFSFEPRVISVSEDLFDIDLVAVSTTAKGIR